MNTATNNIILQNLSEYHNNNSLSTTAAAPVIVTPPPPATTTFDNDTYSNNNNTPQHQPNTKLLGPSTPNIPDNLRQYQNQIITTNGSNNSIIYNNNTIVLVDDDNTYFYDRSSSSSYYDKENNTYITSVTIRVTPRDDFFVSWGILWSCLVLTSFFAMYQIYKEAKIKKYSTIPNNQGIGRRASLSRRQQQQLGGDESPISTTNITPLHPLNPSPGSTSSLQGSSSGKHRHNNSSFPSSGSRLNNIQYQQQQQQQQHPNNYYPNQPIMYNTTTTTTTTNINNQNYNHSAADGGNMGGGGGDSENTISSADETRFMFRRLLLAALLARIVLMPVQIWSDPQWYQFVSDTLPEMIFASAWCLLVSFFVQLVGIAMGTGTNTSPGIVIQITAYIVYLFLIAIQLFNAVATILLYALLCCIYAALLGMVLYYCPRLISILEPNLRLRQQHLLSSASQQSSSGSRIHGGNRGLAARLLICTVLCIVVFSAHTIGYARIVVLPPKKVYWWWSYGALELLPTLVFLIIMHPSSVKVDRDSIDSDQSVVSMVPPPPSSGSGIGGGGYRYFGFGGNGVGGTGSVSAGIRRNDSGTLRRVDSNNSNNMLPMKVGAGGTGSTGNTPRTIDRKQQHYHHHQQQQHQPETSALLKIGGNIGSDGVGYGSVVTGGANAPTQGISSVGLEGLGADPTTSPVM